MRHVLLFLAAALVYAPTIRYGFVQDDRAIIAGNPTVRAVSTAIRAFDDPYWPPQTGAGMYRPVTVLSYAVDWAVSGGNPGWFHLMNALWHGLATVLVVLVLARWLPPAASLAAGVLFAWHPVHVEAVAGLVGRAELLAAAALCGAVLAARRGWWLASVGAAALAMLSKEHGVVTGVVILLDYWLRAPGFPQGRRYPVAYWIALAATTVGYSALWLAIGGAGASDVAAVFVGRDAPGRLAVALPAIARAARLLFWPASLSVDYGPNVIPAYTSMSWAALLGGVTVLVVAALVIWGGQRAPALAFAAGLGALAYLPTSNLLFASGVPLAERNLYLPVAIPAALVGLTVPWLVTRWGWRPGLVVVALVAVAGAARSFARMPAWRSNRAHLLTLLADHPESARAHASAAAVFGGMGESAAARREYRIADSLFPGDPHVATAHAVFLFGIGDTAAAIPLARRVIATDAPALERSRLRVQFLVTRARGDTAEALRIAVQAARAYPWERRWYLQYIQ